MGAWGAVFDTHWLPYSSAMLHEVGSCTQRDSSSGCVRMLCHKDEWEIMRAQTADKSHAVCAQQLHVDAALEWGTR
ncbi:hypothetical protein GDO78_010719 [Eleutherodactylus coqui]|uniref:Uncharacterized protein n=1 Tax=Eleutherodactylus coqui TaxID=57060 RepID=A0A8J6KAJ9_ELECQ|nr:hypothetical protein GDO78_010719 [Eleutherodactylus coqui]